MNPVLIKNNTAETAVEPHRIVKFGSDDGLVVQAAAASDLSVGVSDGLGAEANGRVDVVRVGIADVEYGGAVTRGARLTRDADGKAIQLHQQLARMHKLSGQLRFQVFPVISEKFLLTHQ